MKIFEYAVNTDSPLPPSQYFSQQLVSERVLVQKLDRLKEIRRNGKSRRSNVYKATSIQWKQSDILEGKKKIISTKSWCRSMGNRGIRLSISGNYSY